MTSERVNAIADNPAAEVFYRRLMSIADDWGRHPAHPLLLKAALYPLRLEHVTDEEILLQLERCESAGLLKTYESGRKQYLEINDFRQRTRATKSKWPPPVCRGDGHVADNCQPSAGHPDGQGAAIARTYSYSETYSKTETETKTDDVCARFIETYPRKTGAQRGIQTFISVVSPNEAPAVMDGLERWKNSEAWTNEGGKFIPEPARWLSERRWLEYPSAAAMGKLAETPAFVESFE